MTNYFMMSRLIYAVPFMIFLGTQGRDFLDTSSDCFVFAGAWISMLIFSLFFFGIARKELPRPLVHFIFLAESFIYYYLALLSGQAGILLFIVVSSFYAIDSLRNSMLSIVLHLASLYFIYGYATELYALDDIVPTQGDALALIAAPLLCRAVMSIVDDRDVVIREEFHNNDVYVAVEDTTAVDKLRRSLNFFKLKNRKLSDDIHREKNARKKMESKVRDVRQEAQEAEQSNLEKQQINKEIARIYFALSANMRFDLSQTVDANINRVLQAFAILTKAQYAALIVKEPPVNKEESYSLALTNSFNAPGFSLRDEQIIEDRDVWDKIIEAIEEQKVKSVQTDSIGPVKKVLLTPVANDDGVKGVLLQGFGDDYVDNVHNYNHSLIVAYNLCTILENENLYRQSMDGSSIDPSTGIYNKKFLTNGLEVNFNNAFNYSTNLACVFIAEDKRQDEKGIIFTVDVIKRHIRKTDTVYRYSDNSFVVLFNGVSNEKLEGFADEINTELAAAPTSMSVSMGVFIYDPLSRNAKDGKELLESAGRALYVARKQGAGQIYIQKN